MCPRGRRKSPRPSPFSPTCRIPSSHPKGVPPRSSEQPSELWDQLRPDRNHSDEESNRGQSRRLFYENLQHELPPHLWNIRRTSFPFCSEVSSPGGGAINRLVKGFVFDGARPISPLDEPVWTGRLRRLLVWISAWLGIGVTTTRSHFVVHHLTGPPAERPDVATITG